MKRPFFWSFVLISLLAALGAGCGKRADHDGGSAPQKPPTSANAPSQSGENTTSARNVALEVHDSIAVDLAPNVTPSEALRRLDALATSQGGFVEESSSNTLEGRATQGADEETSAHAILRLPPAQLDALRASLASMRKDGTSTQESLTAKDVGEALADLDARLHAAREEESRLLRLLDDKTGTLADVLAVERALSDVRDRVERLEAEQRVSQGRVDLATVDVWLRAAPVEASVMNRMSIAGREGLRLARDATLGATMLFLRLAPTLALFALFVAVPFFAVRRRRRAATS
jgi:hypothetical protein